MALNRLTILLLVSLGLIIIIGAYLLGFSRGGSRIGETNLGPGVASDLNITRESFGGGWSLDCGVSPTQQKRCTLNMQLVNRAGQAVLVLVVTRDSEGSPVMMINTPPGIAFAGGVVLTPQEKPSIMGEFKSCGPQRCRALVSLNAEARSELAQVDTANVNFLRANGQQVEYTIPLAGFNAGFAAWEMNYPARFESLKQAE